ncbi:hypothetical protein XELAEV_18046950mg [Xenopus laevis]|uniref:Uncharacterized protein n=1 Tax=Xenopus laevis TaxID=8355 RepID=A0A974BUA4_XENLA|nr:hypothetical protein XELAEV_18046950mg [Xenopus laevis]
MCFGEDNSVLDTMQKRYNHSHRMNLDYEVIFGLKIPLALVQVITTCDIARERHVLYRMMNGLLELKAHYPLTEMNLKQFVHVNVPTPERTFLRY